MKAAYPELMPRLSAEEFDALKADISKRGVQVPIEVDADTNEILDGYHRHQACLLLGIKQIPTIKRTFQSEAERKEHALKLNILRRHMDVVSWAHAFEQLLELRGVKRGQGSRNDLTSLSLREVAKEVGVSDKTAEKRLQWADELKDRPELKEQVRRHEIHVTRAVMQVKQERAKIALEKKIAAPLPQGKFRTLIIDPPWPIEKIDREVRPNQTAYLDYPVMTIEEIKALPMSDLAETSGCHVYLWFTQKYRRTVFDLFDAWGVKDECFLTWIKNVGFTPYSWMYSTEHILFGRIGRLPLLQLGKRLDFSAKVREHSRKPDEFYDLVRQVSPEPRLDFFSREKRDGFHQYGNEIERFGNL